MSKPYTCPKCKRKTEFWLCTLCGDIRISQSGRPEVGQKWAASSGSGNRVRVYKIENKGAPESFMEIIHYKSLPDGKKYDKDRFNFNIRYHYCCG